MITTQDYIRRKLVSGRFWWSISACIVFVIGSLSGILSAAVAEKILLVVATFYFTKKYVNGDTDGANGQ